MPNKKKPSEKAIGRKELKVLRDGLVKKKAQVIEEILRIKGQNLKKSSKDSSGDLSSYSFHMADMASDLYDREFSLELAEGEREILFKLDDAIRRIDNGTYGKCDKCGGSISKSRLSAMPQAEKCIQCQEAEEKSVRK